MSRTKLNCIIQPVSICTFRGACADHHETQPSNVREATGMPTQTPMLPAIYLRVAASSLDNSLSLCPSISSFYQQATQVHGQDAEAALLGSFEQNYATNLGTSQAGHCDSMCCQNTRNVTGPRSQLKAGRRREVGKLVLQEGLQHHQGGSLGRMQADLAHLLRQILHLDPQPQDPYDPQKVTRSTAPPRSCELRSAGA